ICFVPYKGYGDYFARHAPEVIREGPILDTAGRFLGMHKGIAFHTVGQRRGLGVAAGTPLYVIDLIAETNTVVVGSQDDLMRRECVAEDVNWIPFDRLAQPIRVTAKIRYRAEPAEAEVVPQDDGRVRVLFEQPQRAITPGQAIVFYDGDYVAGGGTIA